MNSSVNEESLQGWVYSDEQVAQLWDAFYENQTALDDLMLAMLRDAEKQTNAQCIEHLKHGAARRLRTFRRALQNVFSLFPPESKHPLDDDDLYDAQINLHAFVINLAGFFDNLAWAFLGRHGIEIYPNDVSMFGKKVKRRLPSPLREFFRDEIGEWHGTYVNGYRDALAHRIPLYIPPSVIFNIDADEYRRLQAEIFNSLTSRDQSLTQQLTEQQNRLAHPCFEILHSFNGPKASRSVLLHPQMNADVATVIKAGNLFLAHWHEIARS